MGMMMDKLKTKTNGIATEFLMGKEAFKIQPVLYIVLAVIEAILTLRAGLLMMGMNEGMVIEKIIRLSQFLVVPFRGLIKNSAFGAGFWEWPALVAMVLYAVLTNIVVEFLSEPRNILGKRVEVRGKTYA
jgi:hypothetical protein